MALDATAMNSQLPNLSNLPKALKIPTYQHSLPFHSRLKHYYSIIDIIE